MKFIWEPDDVRPGRRYGRPDTEEQWRIVWLQTPGGVKMYLSISLSDYMATDPKTQSQMAADLTSNNYVPHEFLYDRFGDRT